MCCLSVLNGAYCVCVCFFVFVGLASLIAPSCQMGECLWNSVWHFVDVFVWFLFILTFWTSGVKA